MDRDEADVTGAPQARGTAREFDRATVEAAIAAALSRTGVGIVFAPPSRHVGVVAFARLPSHVAAGVDWSAFRDEVGRATGHAPVCVEDCDWPGCPVQGGRLTLVAFDVPGADEDWRYDYGNKLPWKARTAA